MANKSRLSPVQVELRSLGARPPVQYNYVAARPFLFGGEITAGAVTAADLTLTANILDQELRSNYGGTGSNPQIMVLAESFKFSLETGTESQVVQSDLLENIYIHHLATGGRSNYINVKSFTDSPVDASWADGAAASAQYFRTERSPYLLPSPWLVNLNTDTFEIAPTNAVASVGNVPFTLTIYGYAWSVAQGAGRAIPCLNEAQAVALAPVLDSNPVVTE
jgi:hypothetical protein